MNLAPPSALVECEIVAVFEQSHKNKIDTLAHLNSRGQQLDQISQGRLSAILAHGDMTGKIGQHLLLYDIEGLCSRVLLIGCGTLPPTLENYRQILIHLAKVLSELSLQTIGCDLYDLPVQDTSKEARLFHLIDILNEHLHRPTFFKTTPPKACSVQNLQLTGTAVTPPIYQQACILSEARRQAAYWGNLPANICTPPYLGEQAQALARQFPSLKVNVLQEDELQAMGLLNILAVGQGSDYPSQLIHIQYRQATMETPVIGLVGKGVTFDTGGLCLKPRDTLIDMKMDMCGAATILAVMQAAAQLKLPLNLSAVIPCVENMPDGRSYRPSDVIKGLSGKTIEVVDTDAEGRLILSDALTYLQQKDTPKTIIEVSTLTGAIIIALGHHFAGLFCNDDSLANDLLKAGQHSGDEAWRMPLSKLYRKGLETPIADINNLPKGTAGRSCVAAAFLAEFIEPGISFAHLDIAGTAMQKMATGRGVPLLLTYLIQQAQHGSN